MINKVILIGNVGSAPEVRTLESGIKTARVRLATTERTYNKDTQESTEHTEWHTINVWRGLADVVDRFVDKGSQLYIEGRLRTNEWTDKQGIKRYATEVLADTIKLLGGKKAEQNERQTPAPQPTSMADYNGTPNGAPPIDDIPF